MQNIQKFLAAAVVLGLSLTGMAQQQSNPSLKRSAKPQASEPATPAKLTREQKFVIDTVKMAVALPESDPQDRLRVLSTAADVVSPIDKKMARSFWHEGARIETDLVRIGQTPAVSMMSSGLVDCSSAQSFVENLPDAAVLRAEQSLIGAITSCPKQTLDPVSRKLDAGLEKHIVASRALMATMAAQGEGSAWSQQHFAKMFDSLPDPKENAPEAENLAAMYMQMSGSVNKDIAARSGLQLLTWLGKIDDSPLRTLSITITTEAMQKALGAEGYKKALESDVVANTTVQSAGNREKLNGRSRRASQFSLPWIAEAPTRLSACAVFPPRRERARPQPMDLQPAQGATSNRPASTLIWRSAPLMKCGMRALQSRMPQPWCRKSAKQRHRLTH